MYGVGWPIKSYSSMFSPQVNDTYGIPNAAASALDASVLPVEDSPLNATLRILGIFLISFATRPTSSGITYQSGIVGIKAFSKSDRSFLKW